jgi:hypothetical protein
MARSSGWVDEPESDGLDRLDGKERAVEAHV